MLVDDTLDVASVYSPHMRVLLSRTSPLLTRFVSTDQALGMPPDSWLALSLMLVRPVRADHWGGSVPVMLLACRSMDVRLVTLASTAGSEPTSELESRSMETGRSPTQVTPPHGCVHGS